MMRNAFLALVLVNLGFAAWAAWLADPSPTRSVAAMSAPADITLISEIDAGPIGVEAVATPAVEPTQLAAIAPAGDERCISIGPFEELAQASASQAILREAGFAPNQRVVDGEIWVGYWVHLAGIATRDAANEILVDLRANDISDSYIVPGAEGPQIISLGVFSEINRAASLRERVRALGYEPTVADRSRGATLYWIDIDATDEPVDIDALQAPGRINRLEQRPCSSFGG
jgi:cell division septation protein DedD